MVHTVVDGEEHPVDYVVAFITLNVGKMHVVELFMHYAYTCEHGESSSQTNK